MEKITLPMLQYIMVLPSPYLPYDNSPNFGVCRYCGQVTPVVGIATQEDADEFATAHCECVDGRRYFNIVTARTKINRLFSDFDMPVREMLIENAEMVQDEEIKDASVNLTTRIKCKVSKNSKGYLIIVRTDTNTQQEAV
ncbi:MAG: hypothetical protein VB035_10000 [Candidatus Fimivivens sp.]|nr:hypothetical protein [Candidatus Fimivivens sp.]